MRGDGFLLTHLRPLVHTVTYIFKMRWSTLLSSTLALTGAASAARSTRHVGNFEKRLERSGRAASAVDDARLKTREHVHMGKRDNTTQPQFLTNSTASKQATSHELTRDAKSGSLDPV